jgi:CubicO group peptidase (beta-lactamase class C family)
MKLMSLGGVMVSLSIVSCQTQRQTLQPELARQVDEIFRKWDRPDSPGCALGIYKDGQIIYRRGYGMSPEVAVSGGPV